MITLTIEDRSIENIFLNEFGGDKDRFFSFIKKSFQKLQNSKDLDLSHLNSHIQKAIDSGSSGKNHAELFRDFRSKYGIS